MYNFLTASSLLKIKKNSEIICKYMKTHNMLEGLTSYFKQDSIVDVFFINSFKDNLSSVVVLLQLESKYKFIDQDINYNKNYISNLFNIYTTIDIASTDKDITVYNSYFINLYSFELFKLTGIFHSLWSNKVYYFIEGQKQKGEIYDSIYNKGHSAKLF